MTKPTVEAKIACVGRIWSNSRYVTCGRTGKLEHNGKMWCGTHHPPTRQAKDDARRSAVSTKFSAEMASRAADNKAVAERDRKAACFDDLLAALKLAYRELNGGADSLTAIEHRQAHEVARAAIAKAEAAL